MKHLKKLIILVSLILIVTFNANHYLKDKTDYKVATDEPIVPKVIKRPLYLCS